MANSKISIILNCYDPTKVQRHMTMACLAEIRRFTEGDYEIIVVDNEPTLPIRDDYHVLHPYNYIVNDDNKTCYESYDQGAKAAKGDYLVFIQNDVFCHERTINKLCKYLEEFDIAYPQQLPLTRKQVEEINSTKDGEPVSFGWRDAGMLAITKKAYRKSGGWDGKFQNLLGEKAFYMKCDAADLEWTCQTNAVITHIMAANNLSKDQELYNKQMAADADLIEKEYS
jgi:glycosyltransferase involved in cell wall biosynthesis